MTSQVVPLDRKKLATLAPDYESMRAAIARCEKVDEIAKLANQAVAAQAYFRQSQDVENEIGASRIRVRAERKLGNLLKRMAQNGGRRGPGDPDTSRGATSLKTLGIPRDRASRAMQLSDVPENEFEAALAEPRLAQPRRILDERTDRYGPLGGWNVAAYIGVTQIMRPILRKNVDPPPDQVKLDLPEENLLQDRYSVPGIGEEGEPAYVPRHKLTKEMMEAIVKRDRALSAHFARRADALESWWYRQHGEHSA